MSPAIWDRTFQVNLDGSFYVVQGNADVHFLFRHSQAQMDPIFSRGKPNENTESSRRLNYCRILDISLSWRRDAMVRARYPVVVDELPESSPVIILQQKQASYRSCKVVP